eukprot:6516773-Prymnesium_polylepis.1
MADRDSVGVHWCASGTRYMTMRGLIGSRRVPSGERLAQAGESRRQRQLKLATCLGVLGVL